ncbi:hypothetical protein JVU11DRAFT_9903 [Chiua virens]|nr:hypothetical protein JVU11DRAFT_9903 [Chiua virens]
MAMPTTQAERALFVACETEASFLQLRKQNVLWSRSSSDPHSTSRGISWQVLAFISDRFLLSVDGDGRSVIIWDTSLWSMTCPTTWAHYTLQTFVGHVEHRSKLYIADMHTHEGHRSVVIHSISLSDAQFGVNENDDKRLHWEAEFPLRESESFKHMDPDTCRAILYESPTSICVVYWGDNNRRSTMSIQSDDVDENWNGILSSQFCGPYILCFRVRSVEAYPIPTDGSTPCPLPVLRHRFGAVSFRSVSLSRVRISHCPSGDAYDIFMLSNDVYQGMFHYYIRVTTVPVPAMFVQVLAMGTILMPDIPPTISWGNMIRLMFFQSWSLGSAGLRGVWVDRQRGSIERRVVAFTTDPMELQEKDNEMSYVAEAGGVVSSGYSPEVPTMDGKVIHFISSCDLRDDVTICAVSDWTGRIALGSRMGTITLL